MTCCIYQTRKIKYDKIRLQSRLRLAQPLLKATITSTPVVRLTYLFTNPGITNFTVPNNVGTLTITAVGAGGSGASGGVCGSNSGVNLPGAGGGGANGSAITLDFVGSAVGVVVMNIGAGQPGGIPGTTNNFGQTGGTTRVFIGSN